MRNLKFSGSKKFPRGGTRARRGGRAPIKFRRRGTTSAKRNDACRGPSRHVEHPATPRADWDGWPVTYSSRSIDGGSRKGGSKGEYAEDRRNRERWRESQGAFPDENSPSTEGATDKAHVWPFLRVRARRLQDKQNAKFPRQGTTSDEVPIVFDTGICKVARNSVRCAISRHCYSRPSGSRSEVFAYRAAKRRSARDQLTCPQGRRANPRDSPDGEYARMARTGPPNSSVQTGYGTPTARHRPEI